MFVIHVYRFSSATAFIRIQINPLIFPSPTPLHLSSSQKHMCPPLPPSVMQTWSTMKRLISKASVQVLRILSSSEDNIERIVSYMVSITITCSPISYQLNTATLTLYPLGHICRMCGVDERVVAPLVWFRKRPILT